MPRVRTKDRHLKLRGAKWYFVLRVPNDLKALIGKDLIQEALGVSDVREARRIRDAKLAAHERDWATLRVKLAGASTLLTPEVLRRALLIREDKELSERERQELASELATEVWQEEVGEHEEEQPSQAAGAAYKLALGKHKDVWEAGEAFLKEADLKDSTKALYRGVYRMSSPKLGSLDKITKEKAKEFLVEVARSGTKSKVNNYIAALGSLWRYLDRDDSIWVKPKGVKPGKESGETGHWTDEEYQALANAATPPLKLAIRIAAYTGARESEIAELVYDKAKDQIVIIDSKTEAGRRRIPCHPEIREDVKAWVKSPMKAQAIADGFRNLRMKTVDQIMVIDGRRYKRVFHSFRNTVITKLTEADVPEHMIQRIVGHARKGVTQGVYAKVVDPEVLRKYVELIRY